ncbi:MAG: FAD-dependent oxidoreductase [Endozoicomonas sp. (ex Botrylloides leachii)]|nr:FAD-dependent oxidoreductase [Endozoicomonas sp. (ex Botrylloides leachii)]
MTKAPLKIAVIGSGISGLSCAWLLSEKHHVTLFEKEPRFGGHSHTVTVQGKKGDISVDTGFIVYNEPAYPNLVQLFNYLKVPTQGTDMSFGVSLHQGAVEYSGTSINTLFAQRKNILSVSFWKMLWDISRFYRLSSSWLQLLGCDITLGQLLHNNGFGQRFIYEHIMPMGAAIWSSPVDKMLDYPALTFLRFCQNHGLLQIANRPQWRTVVGGSKEYVKKIILSLGNAALSHRNIVRIKRSDKVVIVCDLQGDEWTFDQIVMATHANTALSLLDKPSDDEQSILGAFPYQRNKAVLHSDERVMPFNRRAWSSWNYHGGQHNSSPSVTYWMNRLQAIDDLPLFVSLNPALEFDASKVHGCYLYDHPIFNQNTHNAQTAIWSIQGDRRTWYCGAHLGYGFHEDGLQSGLAVAEQLGQVKRPWQVKNQNYRLALSAHQKKAPTEYVQ